MTRYVLKRLVLLPALLFLFSVTVFAIVQAPPGDFLTTYVATLASSGSSISAEQVEALRREYGLDRPIWIQYLKWMENLAKGNLGLSLEYQRPNAELIGERLVLTMVLALLSFVFTWIVAIPAGIYSAMHPRSVVDYLLTVVNYVGVATPNFMLALILMWGAFAFFGMSVTGLFSPDFVDAPWSVARVLDLLEHVWLPAVVLGVAGTARLTRVMRANLLDELNKPYVTTARAKGLPEWRLVVRYPARLVPPRALLRQPDRGDGHESSQHRSPVAQGADQSGHVPGRKHPAHLLLPHDRRHAGLRHPPGLARSADQARREMR